MMGRGGGRALRRYAFLHQFVQTGEIGLGIIITGKRVGCIMRTGRELVPVTAMENLIADAPMASLATATPASGKSMAPRIPQF